MNHRNLKREEKTVVNRALNRWGAFEFLRDKVLMVRDDSDGSMQVCLVSHRQQQVIWQAAPCFAGLVIGELKKGFTPSMAGADLFARVGNRSEHYIVVGEDAEKLVLYGRDVMGDSIAEYATTLGENELVIILNGRHEAIGIGRTRFAGKGIAQKGRITVTTLMDAGSYLRDEG
ncbi:MAG: PUA domain-containing protein [Nitrososphaera sp.]